MTKFKTPRIVKLTEKKLIGHNLEMSLTNNKTFELFSGFIPKRKQITNAKSSDLYEVVIYDATKFTRFNPENIFTKWATLEVSDFNSIPESMSGFTLKSGSYAVFRYKGLAKDFHHLMIYIFKVWIPQSEYILDDRPHFNVLGDKYKNNHPDSEEDVYIPIKEKD